METVEAKKLDLTKVIQICLRHTRFKDLPSLHEAHRERVLAYVRAAYPQDNVSEDDLRGMGERSDQYDQLAFLLPIRQESICAECKKRPGVKRYCSMEGRRWDVFRRNDDGTFYVWYYPALCPDYQKAPKVEAKKKEPEKIGRF
jgi:hypothetical protein